MVFNLHDTYGFPAILTAEIARQRGLKVDQKGFDMAMEKQRKTSRAASKFSLSDTLKLTDHEVTKFIGYDNSSCFN